MKNFHSGLSKAWGDVAELLPDGSVQKSEATRVMSEHDAESDIHANEGEAEFREQSCTVVP